jgi:hypothetical protein
MGVDGEQKHKNFYIGADTQKFFCVPTFIIFYFKYYL